MRGLTPLWRCSSTGLELVARVPLRSLPRYSQQQSAERKVLDGSTLAALPAAPFRRARHATQLVLKEEPKQEPYHDALCISTSEVDNDIVLDDIHEKQLREVAASSERAKFCEHHPAARGVGADVIDLVTDAFKEERERQIAQRRRVLYNLTHPDPSDYTYNAKLVPPPPLSFGKITEEARLLGNKIMLGQHYTLVKQAGVRRDDTNILSSSSVSSAGQRQSCLQKAGLYENHNFFFEINELYQEIVLVGKACSGKSSLLNALLGQTVAKTSSTPNTTRQVSFYQSVSPEEMQRYLNVKGNGLVKLPGGGLQLTFVDVPGFGIEGMSDQWRDKAIALTDAYLGVRRSVNTVLFCIDCERGLTKVDLRYFGWLENLHGVFFVVLTKCDSVPHSRVCSVMRQIYATITENRRKYRKVFPFIIPTSAKDGTNVEMLRGLITESSGLIPGDRLRQILKTKADASMRAALEEENKRVEEARCIEAQMAKAFFAASVRTKGGEGKKGEFNENQTVKTPGVLASSKSVKESKFVLRLDGCNISGRDDIMSSISSRKEPLLAFQTDENNGEHELMEVERARRRQRFLSWRRAHPLQRHESAYGTFRLNTGLEQPDAPRVELSYTENVILGDSNGSECAEKINEGYASVSEKDVSVATACGADHTTSLAPLPVATTKSGSFAVIGLGEVGAEVSPDRQTNSGGVSRFLGLIESYAHQNNSVGRSKRQQMKEARWRDRVKKRSVTRFLVEEEDGRLAEYKAGKKFGPSVVEPDSVENRRAQWTARQYAHQALAVRPTAPWTALDVLRKNVERAKQEAALRGMTKKDLQAYLRNAGRVTEDFEKFESEVTAAKYMNEVRQTKTLRSQQQMHLNSTAKISYGSMPAGLWKRYGQKETFCPTPRVHGR